MEKDFTLAKSNLNTNLTGVGLGLRAPHFDYILNNWPDVPWFELLIDNYLSLSGGDLYAKLLKICEHYPVTFHGVALSLGGVDPLNNEHLRKLKNFSHLLQPKLISEHLCWCQCDNKYLPELFPLPYTDEAIEHVAQRIRQVQDYLECRILIENLSSYISFNSSNMSEWEFVNAVAERADCYILLDINNIYVSSRNHHFKPEQYINNINRHRVKQYHLAGHENIDGQLIDTHSQPICTDVWELYKHALKVIGIQPTLIEWDDKIPEFNILHNQAKLAEQYARTTLLTTFDI